MYIPNSESHILLKANTNKISDVGYKRAGAKSCTVVFERSNNAGTA